jgi:hypothetical protein
MAKRGRPPKPNRKRVVSVRLDPERLRKLDAQARMLRMTRTAVIEDMIDWGCDDGV